MVELWSSFHSIDEFGRLIVDWRPFGRHLTGVLAGSWSCLRQVDVQYMRKALSGLIWSRCERGPLRGSSSFHMISDIFRMPNALRFLRRVQSVFLGRVRSVNSWDAFEAYSGGAFKAYSLQRVYKALDFPKDTQPLWTCTTIYRLICTALFF